MGCCPPQIKCTTELASEQRRLGTLFRNWKFHKKDAQGFTTPKPRQVCSLAGSVLLQRNELVFHILSALELKNKERADMIFERTGIKTLFVVKNSAEAAALRPDAAVSLESFDFCRFFDQLIHADKAGVPTIQLCETCDLPYDCTLFHVPYRYFRFA